MDGIASGAIYALVAIGTVLLFSVTRVMFVPFGDSRRIHGADARRVGRRQDAGHVRLVVALAALAFLMEAVSLVRAKRSAALPRAALFLSSHSHCDRRNRRPLAPLTPPLPVRLYGADPDRAGYAAA